MAHAREYATCNHTADICAMLANTVRDSKKQPKPYESALFHRYVGTKEEIYRPIPTVEDTRNMLRQLYEHVTGK